VTPGDVLQKAWRATESAKLLLNAGDTDGACNRAYYAIFDAAKVALLAVRPDVDPATIKSHGGLISAFSLHLVKAGHLPIEHGRAFNRVHEIRLIADYTDEPIPPDAVRSAIDDAVKFVRAVQDLRSE
jgi:uncharacterized protein (UPF0332 family)